MKKITYISVLFLLLISSAAIAQVQITWQVIGSTGRDAIGGVQLLKSEEFGKLTQDYHQTRALKK